LREIGFIGDILEVAIDGVKDPADLFKRDPAAFDQVFEKALKARKVEAATATAAKPAIDAGNQDLADVTAAVGCGCQGQQAGKALPLRRLACSNRNRR
jgi:hypothetical protein